MSARTLSPEGEWMWDFTSVVEENETFFIRVWKPLPSKHVLKTLKASPKRTISASSGFEPLQMVLEPNTGQCANEEAKPQKGVDTRQCVSNGTRPLRVVDWGSHIN